MRGSEFEETVTTDAYAGRRAAATKVAQGLWLLIGLVEALLAFRFVLRLLGANERAPFVNGIYGVTDPLVAPFVGVFRTPVVEGSVLEPHTVLALIVYALVGWVIVKVSWLAFGEPRTAVTTRSHETRSIT